MNHNLALKNGAVITWGVDIEDRYPDDTIIRRPASANAGVAAIACGNYHDVIISVGPDCDGDGVTDHAEIVAGAADLNANGVPDSCEADCNGNSLPDGYEISQGTAHDYNNNGVLDSCDIAANPALDRNLNGIPDSYEIAQNAALDRNLNGVLDSYEIAQNPALDRNKNGVLDSYEIAQNPAIDSNRNGIPDSVDLAALTASNAALTAQLNCGDLDGDGEVNGADVGLQLINYGPCAP